MTFLERGERPADRATFAELDGAARRVAGHLVARGLAGKPVLLAFEPGLDFIRCFLGCLYAGAIAVPLPGVGQRRARARTAAIVADVGDAAILTGGEGAAQDAATDAGGRGLARIAAADALAAPALAETTAAGRDDPAFIQYTSGSTSRPKGIVVTHGNIMANLAMIAAAFAEDGRTIGVGWLPHSHDMGLIGCILHPLHVGASCYLMSPLAFLQKPVRWLRAIDRYRGTVSGAPNFGYELCVRHIRPQDLGGVDLSCWRLAGCGAEPVRLATMERFAALMAPHGFSDTALYPCYGLAEATLFATGGTAGTGVRTRILARGRAAPGSPLCRAGGHGAARAASCATPRRRARRRWTASARSASLARTSAPAPGRARPAPSCPTRRSWCASAARPSCARVISGRWSRARRLSSAG
ncbi:MAG: hypothetical protein AcusKO_44460 [Acuticoccus sp.]